ncbi:hypothetical protein GCM10009809_31480 [Isoptericola hypogeus]|uniref:DUF3099 domain-containing protein n=1 Tax=Isoptericola hypogeus TaxID=300179 RepID=A0ABP4VPL6_9MICO
MSNAHATSPGPLPSGHRRPAGGQHVEVPSITSAPETLAEDQARRTRRYLVQMGLRLVLFLAAIFLAKGVLWLQLVLLGFAVVLPYSAVLFANAGRDRVSYDTSPVTPRAPAALPRTPSAEADGRVVEHRVVEHEDDATGDEATGDEATGRPGRTEGTDR